MEIVVVPRVAAAQTRALAAVLEEVGIRPSQGHGYESAWRHSALHEGVERCEREDAYALSPRSTRGATRA